MKVGEMRHEGNGLTITQHTMCRCKHFNGTDKKVCRAGIDYSTFMAGVGLPCVQLPGDTPAECAKREFPTLAEAEAKERMLLAKLEMISLARTAIIEDIGPERMKQSIRGSISCPICKTGTLAYSRAGSYNGHVHARCSTRGCVSWME